MDGHSNGDWRLQHGPDLRAKVIAAIVQKLNMCFPTHIDGLNKTAISFENKIYGVAKDKDDYLRKISEKVFAVIRKFTTGSSANGAHSPNPAAQSLNQGQSLPTSLTYAQTPTSQQRLPQSNIQRNLNILDSSGLPTQAPITVSAAQNLNIQMGEGVASNLGPRTQRQIQGRQQLLQHPQQQQQSSNTMYQQSLLRQQQLPHHTSLSPVKQSFPQSSALSSQPSSSQQNSQFLPRHTQRVHSSHQQQMDVPSQKQNHLTSPQNNGEKQRTSQQKNMASFNVHGSSFLGTQGQEVDQYQPRMLQYLEDKQRFQAADSLHQSQNLADQQKKPYQLQTAHQTNRSTFQDATSKVVNTSGDDWREETYQKIKALREKYILILTALFKKLSDRVQEVDSHPQQKMMSSEWVKKLRTGRAVMEQVLMFLNVSRSSVSEKHRDMFSVYEAHVLNFTKTKSAKQQQQVHFPPSQINQTASHSLDKHQMNSSHQNGPLSSVPGLKTRPKMEPKDDIMSSSGDVMVHSLEQKPQLVIHSTISPAHQQLLQRPQQEPQKNQQQQQQLQKPENEMNDVRMRQRVNSKSELLQQKHLSTSQRQLPKTLASPARTSSSPHLMEKQTIPTPLNKTPAQEHPPLVTPSPEPITERPIDRLIRAIKSSSPESLAQSVSEMRSVITMSDRLAGSVYSIGESRDRFVEDLSEGTRFRLQEGDTNPTKRFKRSVTATPLDITSQTDHSHKTEPSYALLQEINEINKRLFETVVSICNEDVCQSEEVTSRTVVVTCSYVPVAISATFKALYNSGHVSQIQPLHLLVPENYPNSPIILDNLLFDTTSEHKYEDLSARTRSRFGLSMRKHSEPMSLKEIAKVWDECARATMVEYAERHGGGTFSSKYGRWESVLRDS
ncbi:unnamed protein product [Eruca vesicaria subsp. sativa]|uniref:Mediator complex subunit 15 KIX domain-containing protein n=1 Tax=Eruca vesicaria subsp. sativa TaxID=29727 RepID=A0ABC8LMI6_ERUVS|nr:unnamed protein product [Eruca vesicaria subsp. sativa]